MQLINEKYDSMIERKMRKQAKKNKNALDSELIQKIKYTDTYTNSISVAVGRQRSGKTRKILKEIIKISNLHKCTHMLVYVNKTGQKTDKTFESMKGLIKVPIKYVSQNECEETLMELLQAKNQYNTIKQQHAETQYADVAAELFDLLGIQDFSRPYLHTLILLDDIANSTMLTKTTSIMNSLMTQCAHINCSFFLATQFWKGLPTPIKSQVTTIYLYGGFSREQLRYVLRQITLQNPFEVIWSEYKDLGYQDYMYIDIVDSEYSIRRRGNNVDDDDDDDSDEEEEEEESESEDKKETPKNNQPQQTTQIQTPQLQTQIYQEPQDTEYYYYYVD